ncbi:FG-GAP-like repeat-containing protein [Longitalea luteola]|uniref:FG-GAP-like repeat-containing protein n=1 Tax=Longitalea luteola TaxID=2812563 RepID=UPI001A97398D|nr:FG-GAP-like repeat-containing protein [Longitalea luteola]
MTKQVAVLIAGIFAFLESNYAQPAIQSFYPASGPINTAVTITGTGFSTAPANNTVYFGATKATVTASTATTITAAVPAGATYQPITVSTNNLTAYSTLPFVVTGTSSEVGVPFSSTSFVPKQDITTSYYPHGLALGDFNLDGKPDLVVSKGSSATVSVLTNTSSANSLSFAPRIELAATGTAHEDVATGDLDGDGKLDFVLTNPHGPNSVSVYRNTTNGSVISFAGKIDLPVVNSPYGVAIGDVDGDGKPDIVTVNSGTGANVVSVHRNISTPGNISFDTKIDLPGGVGPFSVKIADLDADAKPEIIVTGQYASSSHLSVLKNTSVVGTISFQTPLQLANLPAPFSVAVGDLNADSKPDIVAAVAGATAIIVKRNTSTPGMLSFSAQQDYFSTGGYPWGVAITDFDGDGKPDVVASNNQGNSVSVLQNTTTTSSISFASRVDYAVGADPSIVTCGDLNGDGRSDIIAANTSETFISILRNIIGANVAPAITSFTPASGVNGTTVTITGENFEGATAVKFGGASASLFTIHSNTIITAVVAQGASGDVSVTTPLGTATRPGFVYTGPLIDAFTPATGNAGTTVTITGTNFTNVTAVNFGGIPAASFTVNSSTNITAVVGNGGSGDVTVTSSLGTATRPGFTFGVPVITGITPAIAPVGATVTITGTNFSPTASANTVFFGGVKAVVTSSSATQLNVIVPAGAGYAPVTVTTNRLTAWSSQRFSTSFSASDPQLKTTSFAVAGNYGTGSYPVAVYTADLNDDGKPELITANSIGNSISILKNISTVGDLSFDNKLDLPVGKDPKRIAIGDLDGDGKPDLAIINFNAGAASTLSIYRNAGTGGSLGFELRTDIPTGNGSLGLGIADLNGDGKPDIVVTSGNSGLFSILLNTTVGTTISFAPKQDFTLLTHPDALVLADFDMDGRTDIVTSNFSNGNISVYKNASTNGFLMLPNRQDYPVGTYASDISAGDLDLDGKLDLIVRNNGQFSYLKNYSAFGYISFGTAQAFTLPVTNVNMGDLNGDGKPDLCAGRTQNGIISIYQNTTAVTGNLSLGTNVDFPTGNFDTFVTTGDLDGDGKPEVAAVNTTLYTVTILRNRVDEPIDAGQPVLTQLSVVSARKGQVVSISGNNFSGANEVKFGGISARSFTVVSPTKIDAIVEDGASGKVTVTTPAGTGSLSGFMFIPEVIAGGSTRICENSTVVLKSTAAANNQWYKDGSSIMGANGVTYQAAATGNYTVRTTSNGITTSSATGINVQVILVPTPTITSTGSVLTSSAANGNQWYFNGTLIPNATAGTYAPAETGSYTVKVTVNGCASAFSEAYNHVMTGIVDVANSQSVKLGPNPVRSEIVLQWNVPNSQTLTIDIRDMYGKPAFIKRNISSGEAINVAALPTGTYFIKMYRANGGLVGTVKMLKVY